MRLELEILEKIEHYTKGELSEEEKVAFEEQLNAEPALQKHLQASLIVDRIVIAHEALKLKGQMQKDLSSTKPKWPIYLSMIFVAMLGAMVYFWPVTKRPADSRSRSTQIPIAERLKPEKKVPHIEDGQLYQSEEKDKNEKVAATLQPKGNLVASEKQTVQQEKIELPNLGRSIAVTSVQSTEEREVVASASSKIKKVIATCESLKGEVDFLTIPSCKGSHTGELRVKAESVKGGTPPFKFVIGERVSSSVFDHLEPGSYQLVIKDAQGCSAMSLKEVVIQAKTCHEKREYTFNPDFDHAWAIPYDQEREPKSFKILDKGGKIYYQTPVLGKLPNEWKGESSEGLHLGIGLYFFVIDYEEGAEEEGNIIITR